MNLADSYLESAKSQFLYYKTIGEKSINQLTEEQLFISTNEDSNSIAVIVKHLSGNMISRWTDFFTSDGEKEWRNRDNEFEETIKSKLELMTFWNKGWDCFFELLFSLKPEQLSEIIYIRNEKHTVIEAINRQLAHYPYHIGQIVFIGKMLSDKNWNSLSIPKGGSKEYNRDKFSKPKTNINHSIS
jgi:hypothetical protein